jgi:glycosyltransferase involved in cell wall biosynthesis
MVNHPLISFITPCYNRKEFLVRCIESIPVQYRSSVEHIIIDGGSNDGGLDIIRAYPHVQLLSEPDTGLYDAANKGIRLASGKYIGFLATDDFLSETFFDHFFKAERGISDLPRILTFNFNHHRGDERKTSLAAKFSLESIFRGYSPLFSMLIDRELLHHLRGFDASYRIAGDLELNLRIWRTREEAMAMPYDMQNFWLHAGSLTGHSGKVRDLEYSEVTRIILSHLQTSLKSFVYLKLARESVTDIARFRYRTRGLSSVLSDWRLTLMVILMLVDFR